jgi:hypothetical protein
MKRSVLGLFVLLLLAGTPCLSLASGLSTTVLRNADEQEVLLAKGIWLGDAEERAEEEDTRETEDDDDSSKILNTLRTNWLPGRLHVRLAHQSLLFSEHHREIVVPPPKF